MDQPDRSWSGRRADKESSSFDPEISEVELCRRILATDRQAEALLVARLQPGLRLVLRRATGNDLELARDLLQETLTIVLNRLRSSPLRDPAELAAFTAQTARNLAIAHQRKLTRRRTQIDSEAIELEADARRGQFEIIAAERLGQIVKRLLDELPVERDRTILKRFYLQEEDKALICRDLDLTELAFNQVLFRARNRFKDLLIDAGVQREDVVDLERST